MDEREVIRALLEERRQNRRLIRALLRELRALPRPMDVGGLDADLLRAVRAFGLYEVAAEEVRRGQEVET